MAAKESARKRKPSTRFDLRIRGVAFKDAVRAILQAPYKTAKKAK